MNWKGKPLSLAIKVLAVIFVIAAITFKALSVFKGVDFWEILGTGVFLMLVFAPVDLSLILERIEAIVAAKAGIQLSPARSFETSIDGQSYRVKEGDHITVEGIEGPLPVGTVIVGVDEIPHGAMNSGVQPLASGG